MIRVEELFRLEAGVLQITIALDFMLFDRVDMSRQEKEIDTVRMGNVQTLWPEWKNQISKVIVGGLTGRSGGIE